MTPQDAARALLAVNLSVIPILANGSKAAAIPWKDFQSRIMSEAEAKSAFASPCGIAVIAGKVSGNLEIIDIESEAPIQELAALIDEHLPGFLATLPQVNTPTGGRHLFYRCETIQPNQKLAMTAESKVLIETRGEGGYVVTVTSPPECHPSGKTYTLANGSLTRIPQITPEQRDILLSCCRSFNRLIVKAHKPVQHPRERGEGKSPGDDYNARGDGLGVLLAHGWKVTGRKNGSAYLRRPGKDSGISATYGHVAPGILNNFSSNAAPFDLGAFDNFGIFARLEAGGDFVAAARMLREQGYGEVVTSPLPPTPKPRNNAVTDNVPPSVPPLPEITEETLPEAYAMMTMTERNAAAAFEHLYGERFQYCKALKSWFEWDSVRWAPEGTDKPFDAMVRLVHSLNREMAKTPAKASFSGGAEKIARASRKFATKPEDWDKNTWFLNTPAGTVNLETGELQPHRKSDHLTKVTPVAPTPGPHPIFDRYLRDITLEDSALALYLQCSLGACLSGAQKEHCIFFWYGPGRAGKNTLWDLVRWLMGGYAKTVPVETLLSRRDDRNSDTLAANLLGLRLAISSEIAEGSFFDDQKLKSLSGDATIPARFLYGNSFDFDRTHKHLIVGNERPQLRVVDNALRGRLHVVPFKADFSDDAVRDRDMPAKLRAEGPQILQWLIDGHARWLEDGALRMPSVVQEETDSYFAAQSTPAMWIDECCLEDSEARGSARELYQSYKVWKELRGEGAISQTRLGEFLVKRFERSKSNGSIVYRGITLKAV